MPSLPRSALSRSVAVLAFAGSLGIVWLMRGHSDSVRQLDGASEAIRPDVPTGTTRPDAREVATSAPEGSGRAPARNAAYGQLLLPGGERLDGEVLFSTRGSDLVWGEARAAVIRECMWELGPMEAGVLVRLHSVSVEGRMAWPTESVASLPEDLVLRVHASFETSGKLCVHDGETWDALPSVAVLECLDFDACRTRTATRAHPARPDAELDPELQTVPIDARGMTSPVTLWIAAEGYAWEEVHLVNAEFSPWCVGLSRAGSLEVNVLARSSASSASLRKLRLLPADGGPLARPAYELNVPSEPGAYLYSNIALGTYRVVEAALPGLQDCAVVEDRLRIEPLQPASIRVPSGTAWSEEICTMLMGLISSDDSALSDSVKSIVLTPSQVRCTQPFQPTRTLTHETGLRVGASGSIEWDPTPVVPGAYRVDLKPVGYSFSVEIPATSSYLLDKHLPARVDVDVEVVDSAHGRPTAYSWLAATTVPTSEQAGVFGAPLSVVRNSGPPARVSLVPGLVRFSVGLENEASQHFVRNVERAGAIQLRLESVSRVRVRSTRLGRPWLLREAEWTSMSLLDAEGKPIRVGTKKLGHSPFPGWASEIEYLVPLHGEFDVELAGRKARVQLGGISGRSTEVTFDLSP